MSTSFKFNPLTGEFDLVSADNFSYKTIPTGTTVIIPANQQMIVQGDITIVGDLTITGQLTLI